LTMIDEHTRQVRFSGSHARANTIIRAVKKNVGPALPQNV
jgi:hypothetical protein